MRIFFRKFKGSYFIYIVHKRISLNYIVFVFASRNLVIVSKPILLDRCILKKLFIMIIRIRRKLFVSQIDLFSFIEFLYD